MSKLYVNAFLAVAAIGCMAVVHGQIGCGEILDDGQFCADWQCSRNLSNYCVRGFAKGSTCTVDSDCYYNMICDNTTKRCSEPPEGSKNAAIGYVAAFISVLCFGSSFVPIKKFKKFAGDGVFAQFCMCFGRFMFGVVLLLTRDNKQFYAEAALGGLLWSAGNAISVPIIQCIGMGLGIAIWGTTNMVLGWASGKFGWWGVKKEEPAREWLSYLSVAFSFLSIIMFLFVEPSHKPAAPAKSFDEEEESGKKKNRNSINDNGSSPSTGESTSLLMGSVDPAEKPSPVIPEGGQDPASPSTTKVPTIADVIGKTKARVIGVSLALIAGALFGMCMDPAQHMMSNFDTLSADEVTKYTPFGFDYAFSFNVGAISFSFIYLSFHMAMAMFGFRPFRKYFNITEHEKIILPAFANGIIGSCGSAAWFFANQNLGLIVSFPIIAAGPGVVSSLWGVLVFKEIAGIKNYIILVLAFCTVVGASLCSAYSQIA